MSSKIKGLKQELPTEQSKTSRTPIIIKGNKENIGSKQNSSKGNPLQLPKRNRPIKKPFQSISQHVELNDKKKNYSHQIDAQKLTFYELVQNQIETNIIEQPFQLIDLNQNSGNASKQKKKILHKLIGKAGFEEQQLTNNYCSRSNSSDASSFNIWGKDEPENEEFFPLYQYRFEHFTKDNNKIDAIQIGLNIKTLLGQNYKIKGIGNYPFYGFTLPQCKSEDILTCTHREMDKQKPKSLKDQLLRDYLNQRKLVEKKKQENPVEYYDILKKSQQPLKKFENEMRLQCLKFDFKVNLKSRQMGLYANKESKSQMTSKNETNLSQRQNYSIMENECKLGVKLQTNNLKLISSPQILLRHIQQKHKFKLK